MTFKERIKSGDFIVTCEIGPPKGSDPSLVLAEAELLRDRVDAINVTELQSSVMRMGSFAVSALLKQRGLEPIYQLACRDRNRLALQSDILSAAAMGIENLLILTGDHPMLGDHPQAKPVFDLDSVQLLQVVKMIQEGRDMNGNKLEGIAPKFCVGAVVNPGSEPLEPQIIKMEKKVAAGAEFFQTQAVFEPEVLEIFMNKIRHLKVKVFAGVLLLKSASMARFVNKNVAGITVPERLIREMESAQDKVARSVDIASRLIRQFRPLCQGIHIMPIGWNKNVPLVLDAAGL